MGSSGYTSSNTTNLRRRRPAGAIARRLGVRRRAAGNCENASQSQTLARKPSAPLGRAGRDVGGATAVEFALVSPIVIALILGAIQVAVIFFAQAELENAAEQAARIVYTNKAPAAADRLQDRGLRLSAGAVHLLERHGRPSDPDDLGVCERRPHSDPADAHLQFGRAGHQQLELQPRHAGKARDPAGCSTSGPSMRGRSACSSPTCRTASLYMSSTQVFQNEQ